MARGEEEGSYLGQGVDEVREGAGLSSAGERGM